MSEDVYLDFDEKGHVVSITVEHASLRTDLSEMTFKRINKSNNEVIEAARQEVLG